MALNEIDFGGNTLIVNGLRVGATGPGQSGTQLTGTEIVLLDGLTAGTVTASKAVTVDANKDVASFRDVTLRKLVMDTGAEINADSGTASATAGAATLNKMAGVITSEALTTAAGSDYTLTLTNSVIAATSMVFCSLANGTNTTAPIYVASVTPGSGSATIVVRNAHASAALDGTIKISFIVVTA